MQKTPVIPAEKAHSAAYFHERFFAALAPLAYDTHDWGNIGPFPFYFCTPKTYDPARKNILVAGGFHGEEPAGNWSIVHFLETATPAELSLHNLTFMPLVNPTGFNAARRLNDWGGNPNEGFIGDKRKISVEGALMVSHLPEIVQAAKGGFISLHEDSDFTECYLWLNAASDTPPPAAKAILDAQRRHFGIFSGKIEHRDSYVMIDKGLGFNATDDSFETLLIQNGVPVTATPESPAHSSVPLEKRVACNRDVIAAFLTCLAGN